MTRVLVTRPGADARRLADRLAAAGLQPVSAPMILRQTDHDAVQRGVAACPRPWLLLLTSPLAARTLAGVTGLQPERVACVGQATAQAAREAGLTVDVLSDDGTGATLIHQLDLTDRSVLWVRADHPVPATADALAASGARLETVDAYRTVPHPDRVDALRLAGPVAWVTLTSPSIARAYADARAQVPEHGTPSVVAIGPTTALAAAQAGLEVVAQASPHTLDGLVDAVLRASGR